MHKFRIEGYKSIRDISLIEPNPFSVFVGPNGAGKSNIFEAIELFELCNEMSPAEAIKLFGNVKDLKCNLHFANTNIISISFRLDIGVPKVLFHTGLDTNTLIVYGWGVEGGWGKYPYPNSNKADELRVTMSSEERNTKFKTLSNFSRIFINESPSKTRKRNQDDSRLNSDCSNLEKVLKRVLKNKQHRAEISELMQLLVPGVDRLDIVTEELSGTDNLLVYEDALDKPLTKRLISDGTYNIVALLTALYQSDEPQFLCIEEPENGLNPKVVGQLVELFRSKCKENGHYIWLNTHSQTLVSALTPKEIILVDKVNGETQIKQVKDVNLHGMRMDEALLTNTLGGGIPW